MIESIFVNSVWTLSVTLSWLADAPEATKVRVLPLTVMVSPTAKFVASESVPAAPDSSVAPVMGAGTAALLLTTLPVAMPSVLKKLSEAAMAEAATNEVLASVPSAVLSAALRLAAVAVECGADRKTSARRRRCGRSGQLYRLRRAVRQVEREGDLVAVVGIGGAKIDRDRRRRPARAGDGRAGQRGRDRIELEAERRAGDIFRNRHRRRRGRRNNKPSEAAGAEIGLVALGDQLLQSGQRALSIEDIVHRRDGRRIDGASGKQEAIAGLRIENFQHRLQLQQRGLLTDGLPGAGDDRTAAGGGRLHLLSRSGRTTATPCWSC